MRNFRSAPRALKKKGPLVLRRRPRRRPPAGWRRWPTITKKA